MANQETIDVMIQGSREKTSLKLRGGGDILSL